MDIKAWLEGVLKIIVGAIVAFWLNLVPLVRLLLILMVLDVIVGMIRAAIQKEISSDVSWKGMGKKAITLIIVASAHALGVLANIEPIEGLGLGALVAGFYVVTEFISLLENAAAAGVPIPNFLKEILVKISPEKFESGQSVPWAKG